MPRYYEDLAVGDVASHGSHQVTAEEIVAFAEQYDPQPFHVDPEAAAESPFGGLVASGWHTASICMRLMVEGYLDPETSMGARGVDRLRWLDPVRPGDELHVELEVLEKRPSGSRPGMGHVRTALTGYADGDREVISWEGLGMVRRREPGGDG